MYDIYKSKYDKYIDTLSAKNLKKIDYKQLRLSDDYWYTSEEEQEEEREENKMKNKMENKNKTRRTKKTR